MNIIKPTSNAVTLTTANTLSGSSLVFVSAIESAQINLYSNSSTQYASFVLPAGQYIYVVKGNTHLLSSNVAVYATPASYRG